ncbi:MAG: hypothetical protein JKX88_04060 [Marinicaulis sp.]|jgi:hypothetical protein|nr:hypothetical protein [Marinicaulis sp.]
MSWLEDTHLRDLDDSEAIEATCLKCLHTWLQSPIELLLKVDHRDVRLSEVEKHLACTRFGCKHVGVRITVIRNEETSGFVGGMP